MTLIMQVTGITAASFVPDATMVALPGELFRVATIGGAIVDADTIHLVIRDDSNAAYTMRGFAIYISDGRLFAIYSQADPILEKTASATALLALDIRFVDLVDPNLVFNDAAFLNPPATTEVIGVVELATDAEASDGVDAIRAVTPRGLKAAIDARFGLGAASAFVKTLLTAASAAAMRGLLGLGTAATKNEGPGSGLNADLLDGLNPSTLPGQNSGGAWGALAVINTAGITELGSAIDLHNSQNDPADYAIRIANAVGQMYVNGNQVWTAGNDGSGSGLDADLLDGRDAASFANAVHMHGAADIVGAFSDNILEIIGQFALPGGLILKWGRLRQSFNGEPSVVVNFAIPFPTQCLWHGGFAWIIAPQSNDRDHWVQPVGEPTRFSAVFQLQGPGGTRSDGLNWIAIGK